MNTGNRQETYSNEPPSRWLVFVFCALTLAFFTLSWRRYHTFHNTTFDLAFYARIAWAMSRFQGWESITNADFFGLHLTWILWPVAFVGRVLGQVPTLLALQAAAIAACAFPLRLWSRTLQKDAPGRLWPLWTPALFFLQPNLWHVGASEFHPGNLALAPLLYLLWALETGHTRTLWRAGIAVLLCREDFALILLTAALLHAHRHPSERRSMLYAGTFLTLYFALFVLVLQPKFGPRSAGSLQLHFGQFGQTSAQILRHIVTHPAVLWEHLATKARLLYLPLLLAMYGFLPLLAPRLLLVALPVVAINLISGFPTATALDEHYLTPALPMFFVSALLGLRVLPAGILAVPWLVGSCALAFIGFRTLSDNFTWRAFKADARATDAAQVVEATPAAASVQAPYALMPHLAERFSIRRVPPPEHRANHVIFDLSHRLGHESSEALLRMDEEILLNSWLARDDHSVVLRNAHYLVLQRGEAPRSSVTFRSVHTTAPQPHDRALTGCLSVRSVSQSPAEGFVEGGVARAGGSLLAVEFVANGPCDADLALRIGIAKRPRRTEQLFDGGFAPNHLQAGDTWIERFTFAEPLAYVRIGAIRQSGARPAHEDPMSVRWELPSQ